MKKGRSAFILVANLFWLTVVACNWNINATTEHYIYICVVGRDTLQKTNDTSGIRCVHPDSIGNSRIGSWIEVDLLY